MNNMVINKKWHFTLVIACTILLFACAIIIGNMHNLIKYDYHKVQDWSTTSYVGGKTFFDDTRIGNLSHVNKDGDLLNNNWVNIGDNYWYVNDPSRFDSNKEFGKPIQAYSYCINDTSSRYYGEEALLLIYSIEPNLEVLNTDRSSFYKKIIKSWTKDNKSIWEVSKEFQPFEALTTNVAAFYSTENSHVSYDENIIILANDRIYHFAFNNDKFKYDGAGSDASDLLGNRWSSIIRSVDLISFSQWEIAYDSYKNLSNKEKTERLYWGRVLYSISLLLALTIFILGLNKIGKRNSQARKFAYYIIACFGVVFVIMSIGAMIDPDNEVTLGVFILAFVPYLIINLLMTRFMTKRSNEDFCSYYPIPNKVLSVFQIDSLFKT